MDIRHLRYFIAIAEEGSLLRAAERLGVAQPALSKHIRNMEAELEVDLLLRGPRGVCVTEAGQRLLTKARSLAEQFDTVRDVVKVIT